MRAKGMNQIAIARELQVSEASISLDMQYLRAIVNQLQQQVVDKRYSRFVRNFIFHKKVLQIGIISVNKLSYILMDLKPLDLFCVILIPLLLL